MPLENRYSPDELDYVLKASLTPLGLTPEEPICYQGLDKTTFVFSSVSDSETGTIRRTFESALLSAKDYFDQNHINLHDKKIVFPVSEEQPFLGFLRPRNHFVTLHYDANTRIATVVDSRTWLAAGGYSAEPMRKSLHAGLGPFGLTIDRIDVHYQGIQHDDIHCGAWTAVNIEGFARGVSLEDQVVSLVADDRDAMVQHHIHVATLVKKEPFISTVSRSQSTASLSDSSDEAPAQIGPREPFFTEEQQNGWLTAAQDHFRRCFEDPAVLSEVLFNYKGITLNGNFLTADELSVAFVDIVLTELVVKYPGLLADIPPIYEYERAGYELKRPMALKPIFLEIGMSPEIIQEIAVSDAIKFSAVLGEAEFSAGHLAARAVLIMADIEDALLQPEIEAFQMKLKQCLRNEVMKQYLMIEAEKNRTRHAQETRTVFNESPVFFDAKDHAPEADPVIDPPPVLVPLINPSEDLEPNVPPLQADFQLACLHALIIAGGVLLAIALLTCPPVAAALGIAGLVTNAIAVTAAISGGASLIASVGIFASRGWNEHDLDAFRPGPGVLN